MFLEEDENDYAHEFEVNKSEHQLAYADILKVVFCLPILHRNTFNLHVIDGYSHREVASMLGISETHSKWIVHDSKKRIMKMLNEINQTIEQLRKFV
jgi:RNA polymerase sigma-70 factor (ECF subfamily)